MKALQLQPSRSDQTCARRWWESRRTLLGLVLLGAVPLCFVSLPPLVDLPGHMGRYYVELNLAGSPVLQRNWDFHWRLIGNLGVDILILPMGAVLGVERAVWLIALALPPLMIWGIARISFAIHGRLTPFAFATAPFALAFPYQFGFLNYWLGCALAFHVFASWVSAARSEQASWLRMALFALGAALVWLTHIFAWAILVVLIAAFELSRAWKRDLRLAPIMALNATRRMWPVAVPVALMVGWSQSAGGKTGEFFDFHFKFVMLLSTLRDQHFALDIFSLLFAAALLYFGLRDPATKADPALLIAATIFLCLILIMPSWLFGSFYADARLWPIFFIVALAAIAPTDRGWAGAPFVAIVALALFVTRIAFASVGFASYARDYDLHLRALDHVPRGASIAVLASDEYCSGWRFERMSHLDSVAIVRRDAFVNSQWEIPGGQLLQPLRARGTAFNSDPSEKVAAPSGCDGALGPVLTRTIERIPRDRFGYVWLLGFARPLLGARPGLQRLYSDDRSAFYAFRPEH